MDDNFIIPLVKNKKRKGRGISSGRGKTSGRGTKGQKARKSGNVRLGFEGGQTPIYRRLPKVGFFHQSYQFEILNLAKFESDQKVSSGSEIDFSSAKRKVKILANGNLTKTLIIKAHCFSATAKTKIEDLGGKAIQI